MECNDQERTGVGSTSHITTDKESQSGRKKANILYGRPSERGLFAANW